MGRSSTAIRRATGPHWLVLATATALTSLAASAAGLPAAPMFAGLITGLVWALVAPVRLAPPRAVIVGAHGTVGVALGAYFELATFAAVGEDWPAVALVVFGTLAASVLSGLLVTAFTGLDVPTSTLGTMAGGAAGIVGMSREIGADDRLVAFMQYVRVLAVVVIAPLVVALALSDGTGAGAGVPPSHEAGSVGDVAFTAVALAVGLLVARHAPIPAGTLLGPLAVAVVLTVSGVAGGARVPGAVEDLAFAIIGLQVGLRFTPMMLAHAGRLLPAALASVALLIGACAALAALLVSVSEVRYLDAYLATTPGGIYAVLATAVGSGADTTFVLAVQTLRLLLMLLAAPPLVRLLGRRERSSSGTQQRIQE